LRIYIASAYTKGDVAQNVKRVIDVADKLVKMGHIPYVPHLTHFWHIISPKKISFWYNYDLSFLEYWAEAVLRIPNDSDGADNEVKVAKYLNMPVYYSVDSIPNEALIDA
jgi:hypothetical protein